MKIFVYAICWLFLAVNVKVIQVQWNLDLTKCRGTGEICSFYRGFVTWNTSFICNFIYELSYACIA